MTHTGPKILHVIALKFDSDHLILQSYLKLCGLPAKSSASRQQHFSDQIVAAHLIS